jgi:hypothetical protein
MSEIMTEQLLQTDTANVDTDGEFSDDEGGARSSSSVGSRTTVTLLNIMRESDAESTWVENPLRDILHDSQIVALMATSPSSSLAVVLHRRAPTTRVLSVKSSCDEPTSRLAGTAHLAQTRTRSRSVDDSCIPAGVEEEPAAAALAAAVATVRLAVMVD